MEEWRNDVSRETRDENVRSKSHLSCSVTVCNISKGNRMIINEIYFQVKSMLRAFLNEDYGVAGFRLPETRVKTFHYVRNAEMWALEEAINMVSGQCSMFMSPSLLSRRSDRALSDEAASFFLSVSNAMQGFDSSAVGEEVISERSEHNNSFQTHYESIIRIRLEEIDEEMSAKGEDEAAAAAAAAAAAPGESEAEEEPQQLEEVAPALMRVD